MQPSRISPRMVLLVLPWVRYPLVHLSIWEGFVTIKFLFLRPRRPVGGWNRAPLKYVKAISKYFYDHL